MNMNHIMTKISQYFNRPQKTAKFAKERLQIIISHERAARDKPDYIAAMQQDLLDVIAKYVAIDKNAVKVDVERRDGCSVLELNVTLPNLNSAD